MTMAAHIRRQVREAIGTALTGLTTTGSRVFPSRVYPLEITDLPALLIHTKSESSVGSTIHGPAILDRRLLIEVVAVAQALADLDDTLDLVCQEVEVALANPVTELVAISSGMTISLQSTEIELTGTAEQPTGSATMTFEVEYFTAENAPDVAL
jgi:hypothetical protein